MFEPGKKIERAASQDRGLAIRQSPRTAPTASPFKSPDETHSFEFYMRKTADLISIYSHRHFWTIIVPQATHRHTAVKHSLLALSILHESLAQFDTLKEELHTQLFDHYNKAIRAFTHSHPPTDIVLITCILFWTVENFNGFGQPSFDHMEAAQKILREFKADKNHSKSPHYELITTYIEPIIVDCMQHARTASPTEATQVEEAEEVYAAADGLLLSQLPKKFPSLDAAERHLRACLKTLMYAINTNQPNDTYVEQLDLHLRRWIYLFHNLTAEGNCCERRVLVVHHVNASALLGELRRSKEPGITEAADLRHHYSWIVTELADLFEEVKTSHPEVVPAHELGVIPPLFTAAIRTQNEELRLEALEQLKTMNRHEGCWTDDLAARVAQTLIEAQKDGVSGICLNSMTVFKGNYGWGIYSKDRVFERFIGRSEAEIKNYDMVSSHTHNLHVAELLANCPTRLL
jgi:hypothetical protein